MFSHYEPTDYYLNTETVKQLPSMEIRFLDKKKISFLFYSHNKTCHIEISRVIKVYLYFIYIV